MADTPLRPDIQAARDLMKVKVGAGREIRRLIEYLWEGEAVSLMSSGQYGPGTGLVVLTDRRLLFVKDGMMSKKSEDFPLEKISSVQWSSGLVFGSLIVFASGNKAEIKNMDKADGKRIADAIRDRLAHAPTAAPGPAPAQSAGAPAVMDQIRQLGELHQAGILTDAEFEAKKADLLGRL